ncbi:hypothetical protein [Clostridium amazonitimonense]|uniref:hypothetical protein n=1 Tax=Clostridium amazonitimonense TaxID=1499689 RepID=UPI0005094B51|nr:hypothetical protein [Clostridium amazonitimonense]
MKTLTDVGIRKQAQRFIDSLSHATYELNREEKRIELFKTYVLGDMVKVYVYFDDSMAGEVGEVKLIDKDGDIIAHAEKKFNKPLIKGLYVVFKYRFIEMEVDEIEGLQ